MIDEPIKPLKELYADARAAAVNSNSQAEWVKHGFEDILVWADQRVKCCTDLFWFATAMLGYDLVAFHEKICVDFFIQKNPEIEIHKLHKIKSRLLLYPRGSFKSSIDEADTVQWIVCYPNIRIALMTATDDLGAAFVKKVKGFFQVSEGKKLTQFQMLFFEHCVAANKKEDAAIFVTRARTKTQAQATLESLSLVGTTSGFHYDVGKFDDVVSNKNSGPGSSPDQRKSIYESIRFAGALIEPFGYRFYLGTPYNSDDAWTYLQEKARMLTVLRQPALVIRDHAKRKVFTDLVEEDVELLFPEDSRGTPRLTLEYLKGEFQADDYIFSCNYMLDPQRTKSVAFTEQMLRDRIINSMGLPQPGTYHLFNAWDFADSTGRGADYSVGTVGMLDCLGRLFIVEIVRGRFSPSELAYQVAKQAAKWRVERIYIEKSPGADFLQNDILRELSRLGYADCPLPEWFPVDNTKGAKEKRKELLESYFTNKVLWLSDTLGGEDPTMMDTLIKEFVHTSPGSKRKDDIIDSIAHLCRIIPAQPDLPPTEQEKTEIVYNLLAQKQLQDMYFGVREFATAAPVADLPMTTFDTENGTAPVCCSHCGFAPCIGN